MDWSVDFVEGVTGSFLGAFVAVCFWSVVRLIRMRFRRMKVICLIRNLLSEGMKEVMGVEGERVKLHGGWFSSETIRAEKYNAMVKCIKQCLFMFEAEVSCKEREELLDSVDWQRWGSGDIDGNARVKRGLGRMKDGLEYDALEKERAELMFRDMKFITWLGWN